MRIVIPCFNEAKRLDPALLESLLEGADVLLVDDGSTDSTAEVLRTFCEGRERADYLILEQNQGKAEAVRRGLRMALESGADVVGYADADFATPPGELIRLGEELDRVAAQVALGSRVARLGAHIDRKPARHYVGRIFATAASGVLDLAVYDTQCGAKLFRVSPALTHALRFPFRSRWSFDVELLGRLMAGGGAGAPPVTPEQMIEVPLRTWVDVAGSKLSLGAAAKAGLELLALGARVKAMGPSGFFP